MKDFVNNVLRGPVSALIIAASVVIATWIAERRPPAAVVPPPTLAVAQAVEPVSRIRDRLAYRLAVREALRTIADEQPEHAGEVRKLLTHRRAESRLQADVEALVSQQAGDVYAGPLTDFLQWLLDHSDALLSLVQKILQLFHLT